VLPCRCGCIAQPLDRRRLQWVRFGHSLRSSRTPASPSPTDICHDNEVVALGPMLSTLDRLRFLDKISGWCWRSAKAPELPATPAARQRCIGLRTRGIRHDRRSSAYPRTRGRASAAAKQPFQIPGDPGGLALGDAFELVPRRRFVSNSANAPSDQRSSGW
jgi:hypothetical protein